MSRTGVDLDDEALPLASEELGTKSKVATVNAALRRVANQRAAAHSGNGHRRPDPGPHDLSREPRTT
jgi:Arc/MetJ family transcription regulator